MGSRRKIARVREEVAARGGRAAAATAARADRAADRRRQPGRDRHLDPGRDHRAERAALAADAAPKRSRRSQQSMLTPRRTRALACRRQARPAGRWSRSRRCFRDRAGRRLAAAATPLAPAGGRCRSGAATCAALAIDPADPDTVCRRHLRRPGLPLPRRRRHLGRRRRRRCRSPAGWSSDLRFDPGPSPADGPPRLWVALWGIWGGGHGGASGRPRQDLDAARSAGCPTSRSTPWPWCPAATASLRRHRAPGSRAARTAARPGAGSPPPCRRCRRSPACWSTPTRRTRSSPAPGAAPTAATTAARPGPGSSRAWCSTPRSSA